MTQVFKIMNNINSVDKRCLPLPNTLLQDFQEKIQIKFEGQLHCTSVTGLYIHETIFLM